MQKGLIVTFILSILVITAVASYLYHKPATDFNINVNTDQADDNEVDGLDFPNGEQPSLQPTDSETEHENQPFSYGYVSAGEEIKAHYQDHVYSSTLGLHRMDIRVNSFAENVKISVHSHDTSDVPAPGIVYKYPHVEVENLDDSQIDSVKYHFQVPKSWTVSNGFTQDHINIYKWDEATGAWVSQKVSFDSQDERYYFYHVNLKTFGEFAVAA